MKTLVVICIDYNSCDETRTYISTLLEMNSYIHVILVCNSGKEKFSKSFLSKNRLYVYDFGENLGYMNAACMGFKEYLKKNTIPDWVVLSNTDITFASKDFFTVLGNDNRLNCIIAPEIISADGVYQNPFLCRRPTKIKMYLLRFIYSFTFLFKCYSLLSRLKTSLICKNKKIDDVRLIYAAHGSFIIISGDCFKSKFTLEHPAFLYGEELILAERSRLNNIATIFDPKYKIIHHEHVSTGKLASRFKAECLKNSISCVIKDYYKND